VVFRHASPCAFALVLEGGAAGIMTFLVERMGIALAMERVLCAQAPFAMRNPIAAWRTVPQKPYRAYGRGRAAWKISITPTGRVTPTGLIGRRGAHR
jgi:hypothetical protein